METARRAERLASSRRVGAARLKFIVDPCRGVMLRLFGRHSRRGGGTESGVAGSGGAELAGAGSAASMTGGEVPFVDVGGLVSALQPNGQAPVVLNTPVDGGGSGSNGAEQLRPWSKSRIEPAVYTGRLSFRPVADRWMTPAGADETLALHQAFTPTMPAQWGDVFVGRADELRRVITAIEEECAHVAIIGAPALGKTSVANGAIELAKRTGYWVARCTMGSNSNYEDTFRSLLGQVPPQLIADLGQQSDPRSVRNANLTKMLPPGRFGSDKVVNALCHVQRGHLIFLIDEFNRVTNDSFRTRMVETMKDLSDVSARVSLVVVGVGHSAQDLLGDKVVSLRSVVSVRVPTMSPNEIDKLIRVGAATAGIAFEASARAAIIRMSRGAPYAAQLLCLRAARSALARGVRLVQTDDLKQAIAGSLCDTEPQFVEQYERATAGERNPILTRALTAAAVCACDQYGGFTAADAAAVLNGEDGTSGVEISELHGVLDELSRRDSGRIMVCRASADGPKFYFSNEMLRQYVMARHFGRNGSLGRLLLAP